MPLTELALRSKAYWGYDAEFLESCREELTMTAEHVRSGLVTVAVDRGRTVGVARVSLEPSPPELIALFAEPDAIGRGVGATPIVPGALCLGFL